MATVNLGLIKFRWQGAYAGGTAYVKDDVVSYNGSSYVCILASTGNLPTNTTYWNVMAQGSDIASISGLAQGDILYYNGTDWVRLGAGTNGHVLTTGGVGANPSWAAAVGGKILQVVHTKNSNGTTISAQNSFTNVSGSTISITPTASTSKILHIWNTGAYGSDNSGNFSFQVFRDSTEIRKVGLGAHNLANEGSSGATTITLDEPSTTSQISYSIKGAKSGSGNPLYVNQISNLNGQHNILIEIGA